MSNIKKVDCALLPPSRPTLQKKLQRAHYVTLLWSHAHTAFPAQGLSPTDYGWSIKRDLLLPTWFDGPSVPDSLFSSHVDVDIEEELEASDLSLSEISDHDPWSEDSDSDCE